MFEIAVSSGASLWDIAIVYVPWLEQIFVCRWQSYFAFRTELMDSQPNDKTRVVMKSQEIIKRIGGGIIREKTKRILEGEKNGSGYEGVDFLSLLSKTTVSLHQSYSDLF